VRRRLLAVVQALEPPPVALVAVEDEAEDEAAASADNRMDSLGQLQMGAGSTASALWSAVTGLRLHPSCEVMPATLDG
jgi:hypothetical protein